MCNCNQVNLLIILILGILLGLIIGSLIGIALFLGLRTAKAPAPRGRHVTARRGDRHRSISSSASSSFSSDSSADDMVREKTPLLQEPSAHAPAAVRAVPPSISEKKKASRPSTSGRHEPVDDRQHLPPPPSRHPSPRRDPGRDPGRDARRDARRDHRDVDKKHRSELHGACSIL